MRVVELAPSWQLLARKLDPILNRVCTLSRLITAKRSTRQQMYLIHIHIEAVHDSVLLLLLLLSGMEPARRNSSKKNVRAKELGVFDPPA